MSCKFSTVSMIGLGYIGLPTAAVLASAGVRVVGVDINRDAVETINKGRIHIVEPELEEIVGATVKNGLLRATTRPEPADAFLIAVPTPFMGDHEPDLRYVEAATKSIAPVLKKGDLVILESTSPVGTTEKMAEWLSAARPDLTFPQQIGEESDISVAYCPERVLPGRVVHELVNNDRVIGGLTRRCSKRATDLYKSFVKGECFETTARTAEMCKLTENAFRDVNIAFANELSIICDELKINVWELIRLANRHPRVSVLQPGPGVGGHCIAVDPWFIVSETPSLARIIRTAREINDYKPHYVVDRVAAASGAVTKPVIALLGLAFKPDIDDLRESPAVEVVKLLSEKLSSELLVVEPHIAELPKNLSGLGNIHLVTVDEALQAANIVVMLVSHTTFYSIDRQLLSGKLVIDTRGVWQ